MDIGSIVRFSSHPRHFVIEETYCDNPDCSCNEVSLSFTEIDSPNEPGSKPLSFRIRVDLDTWQERERPRRQPRVEGCVQEFLSQFPESRKADCRTRYKEGKQDAKRIAEYVIDPREVLAGELVSFTDVVTGLQALSSGGRSYTHRFSHDGREYLVEDRYCVNPTCDCKAIHLQFWERVLSADADKDQVTISTSFLGRVSFTGELDIEPTGRRQGTEASRILSGWWQEHQYEMDMYQGRYQRLKEIGQRSIDTLETQIPEAGRSQSLRTDCGLTRENVPQLSSTASKRVGRNDPCPCGSGKKFKRCCAIQSRDSLQYNPGNVF